MKYELLYYLLLIIFPSYCFNETNREDDLTLCIKPHLVKIGPDEQNLLIKNELRKCVSKMIDFDEDPEKCPIKWDTVMCWPESNVNETIELPCANYVNKFNKKHKAYIHCKYNFTSKKAEWTKTNYSKCLTYEESDFCNTTKCSLENHIQLILITRIFGNTASLITLFLSIIILLRSKLRCPRNYVHINLFISYLLRMFMTTLSELVTRSDPHSKRKLILTDSYHDDDQDMFFCRSVVSFFRYSSSTYHMAILSEAIYLVLLLKFPYYSELRGSKFCILITWLLPILWIIPWMIARLLRHNYWCWQSESHYNLILKIPQTFIYFINGICAFYIIRILYSKILKKNMTREKILKYRRFAQSILIVIPIFGLHFIFFAWIPYIGLFDFQISPCFEIILIAIENIFNSFQGLVVSIACCFIHREVRIEVIIFLHQILGKIKCLQRLPFLNSDYIRQLRYNQTRGATIAAADPCSQNFSTDRRKNKKLSTNNVDEKNPMLTPISKKKLPYSEGIEQEYFEKRKSILASQSFLSVKQHSKCCFCLFGEQKNDFFSDTRRKSNHRFIRGSSAILNREKNERKKSANISRPPSLLTQTDESSATIKNLGSIQQVNFNSNLKSKNSDSKINQVVFHMGENKINEISEDSSYEDKN